MWRAATEDVGALDRALAERPGVAPGALLGLDSSARGVLLHRFPERSLDTWPAVNFLDAPSGFVAPPALPPGPWVGHRHDGTMGWVDDPARYFAARRELPGILLVWDWRVVGGAREAAARLGDPSIDLSRTAVVEGLPALLAEPAGRAVGLGALQLDAAAGLARRMVHVKTDVPALLIVQEPWAWGELWRFPADQGAAQGVRELRALVATARDVGADRPLATFRANLHGTSVVVPASETQVEITWRIATPAEVR